MDITKQKSVVRAAKAAKKNYITVILIAIIIMLSGYYVIRDYDDNPAMFEVKNYILKVQNRAGRELWEIKMKKIRPGEIGINYEGYVRIVDINDDGRNEVLLTFEALLKDKNKYGGIRCLNYKSEEVWAYKFMDTISSPREILQLDYDTHILDIDPAKKIVYCSARNRPSYACAVFKLNLNSGKRMPGTFWHTGHLMYGKLTDVNKDGKRDLIIGGANNSYEDMVIIALPEDKINGTSPAIKDYPFYNRQITDFLSYIRVSNDDVSGIFKHRFSTLYNMIITEPLEIISFNVYCINGKEMIGNRYELSFNMKDFNIVIGDDFRVLRDSLVSNGELKPPLTDTKEYREIIKSKMRYWNGERFVKREELN